MMPDLADRIREALAGRYRVERELGRGGMAVVFLAEDVKHGRKVALKVLRPEIAQAVGADRFLREIRIVARLNHPNILTLIDSGEADGLLYYVMPYVEGESLRERLERETRLPVEEAVRIAREVADALNHAHDLGVIHRDIKPENVLFEASHAVVADFGIARAVDRAGRDRLTRTGLAVGTLTYMSPEQASGDRDVDARSDVYSLACLLYEMLAGEPPFTAPTPQALLARKLVGRQASIRVVRENVPLTVEAAIAKGLAKAPADRYGAPKEFAEALAEAVDAQAIAAEERRLKRARRLRVIVGMAAVSVLVAGGWLLTTVAGGGSDRLERLAVLPITNPMNDPGQEFLVRGIHDALISELGLAGVTVIGRQSVMRYRDTDTPVREIASELDLDAVIEGSAILLGDSVALHVRLVDGGSEAQLWAGSYEREMRDVLTIYRDITRAIAEEIQLALTPQVEARLAGAPEVDPEAYEAVLQGRFYRRNQTREALQTALRYFERALRIDPENAAAYAGIAGVWNSMMQHGFASPAEERPKRDSAVARALELDDSLAEVHRTIAVGSTWQDWDWKSAADAFERTLALDPNHALARATYSHYLYYVGRLEEARAQIRRALELEPLDPLIRNFHAMMLMFEHRFEEGIELLQRLLRAEPNDPIALATLRTAYHMTGRHEEALEIWKRSYAARGNDEAVAALERGREKAGYSGALRTAAETLDAQSRSRFVTPWQIGTLYTRAGDRDRALEYLERAYEARDPNIPYLSVDPIFDFMRDDPRFQDLLRRLKLPT